MTDTPTLLSRLKLALDRHDRSGVNDACRALIAARARLGSQWRAVTTVLIRNGEYTLARSAAEVLSQETGRSPLGLFEQASTLARTGNPQAAHDLLGSLPADTPDPVTNAYLRGTLATNLGDFEAARRHLRRAVQLAPGSGQSWLALAMAGKIGTADRDAIIAAQQGMASAPPPERAAYDYALGKALDEAGQHDQAFAAFASGAAAVRAMRPVEPAPSATTFDPALSGWDVQSLVDLGTASASSDRPIFVSGLPRSGTTLVEQVLVSHDQVAGGEELGILAVIAREIGGIGVKQVQQAAGSNRLDPLAALYGHLLGERYSGSDRVVDKTLQISRFMGLLATLLPDAPVVWLRRDPLDNAWSIFRTYFLQDLGWTFDLAEIGHQMAREDRLFAHWSRLRPQQILAVDYADLVRNPETVIPRIVAHCGLTLQPQQLRPHESKRAVTTASVAQVRAPIGTQAIGAAEPYRRHLAPFIDAYRAAGGTID